MDKIRKRIQGYISSGPAAGHSLFAKNKYRVELLANGEYNLNYRLKSITGSSDLVFRINIASQMVLDNQIEYEYHTLKLLDNSGVTPRAFLVDDSREYFDNGVLVMEYLPGDHLDYETDNLEAARLFATIHQIPVESDEHHLIVEEKPLNLIFDECKKFISVFLKFNKSPNALKSYFRDLLAWMKKYCQNERFYVQDPWHCIVNTEVNSGNFIVNPKAGTMHLVDWEMARWGDPSQDLAHFCSPFTTLWKTEYRMDPQSKKEFLREYKRHLLDKHLKDTIEERVSLREPLVFLRGISWSAMAWVAYQNEYSGIRNKDTWQKINSYLDLKFIRGIFDPITG